MLARMDPGLEGNRGPREGQEQLLSAPGEKRLAFPLTRGLEVQVLGPDPWAGRSCLVFLASSGLPSPWQTVPPTIAVRPQMISEPIGCKSGPLPLRPRSGHSRPRPCLRWSQGTPKESSASGVEARGPGSDALSPTWLCDQGGSSSSVHLSVPSCTWALPSGGLLRIWPDGCQLLGPELAWWPVPLRTPLRLAFRDATRSWAHSYRK